MHIEILRIGPEEARSLLSANSRNRPLSPSRVKALAGQMARGEWRVNGDTLRLSKTGRLLDGQHRLHAIIESGVTQDYIVVRGLDDESFDTIDIGAARKASELLALHGVQHAATLSTVTRRWLTWQETGHPLQAAAERRPSNAQIIAAATANQVLQRAAAFGANHGWLRRNLSSSDAGFCYAAFATVDEDASIEFLRMVDAPGSGATSTVILLRDQLMETRASTRRMTAAHRIALTFKTWRLWREGKTVKFLRIRMEGEKAEQNLFRVS